MAEKRWLLYCSLIGHYKDWICLFITFTKIALIVYLKEVGDK